MKTLTAYLLTLIIGLAAVYTISEAVPEEDVTKWENY